MELVEVTGKFGTAILAYSLGDAVRTRLFFYVAANNITALHFLFFHYYIVC